MKVKFKKLHDDVILPKVADSGSAGSDIYAYIPDEIAIEPHKTVLIPTGFATSFENAVALVYSRSGMAVKQGLVICQGTAVIDSSYRGQWFIPLHNDTEYTQIVAPQTRICQVIFQPYYNVEMEVVDELDETERGDGGFGHSGIN